MPKIRYVMHRFDKESLSIIERTNSILKSYAEQGFILTLRQIYYQFVAKGWLPNTQKSYSRLGGILGDARLAGYVDWESIEDRTRRLSLLQHFSGPQDALDKLKSWYHIDMWEGQEYRPEVWIEKDALTGVIAGVCNENDVPYFSCRGYTSLSEMWRASMRLRRWFEGGQKPYIIHFGDHDPSGIDMSRDIYSRLGRTFTADCEFHRVALTMDQVDEHKPPPNPAKVTDSRYKVYVQKYGDSSWELDALEPPIFRSLIEDSLKKLRNKELWNDKIAKKLEVKEQLAGLAKDWENLEPNKKRLVEADKEITKLTRQVASLKKRKKK